VTIGVGQVEEPLAPFRIARHRIRAIAGRDDARMKAVNVGVVAEDASSRLTLDTVVNRPDLVLALGYRAVQQREMLLHPYQGFACPHHEFADMDSLTTWLGCDAFCLASFDQYGISPQRDVPSTRSPLSG
jgi:hypothetical protein